VLAGWTVGSDIKSRTESNAQQAGLVHMQQSKTELVKISSSLSSVSNSLSSSGFPTRICIFILLYRKGTDHNKNFTNISKYTRFYNMSHFTENMQLFNNAIFHFVTIRKYIKLPISQ
jgi:hypothetical protein